MKSRAGKPLTLTVDILGKFVDLLREGATFRLAAEALGIHRETITNWIAAGSDPAYREDHGEILTGKEALYAKFYRTVNSQRALYCIQLIKNINQAKRSAWNAHAWLLERLCREEFGTDGVVVQELKKTLNEILESLGKPRLAA